jgi:hypothetical protein
MTTTLKEDSFFILYILSIWSQLFHSLRLIIVQNEVNVIPKLPLVHLTLCHYRQVLFTLLSVSILIVDFLLNIL